MSNHRATILDQFTRQAEPFSSAPAIKDEEALRLVVEFSGATSDDTLLDVACGPGIIVCAFARVVGHATGIDLTPAMLDRARALQREEGLENVTWSEGEALALPYPDASFSIVTSRFALHHLLDPSAAIREMGRVCRPGGKVVVIDLAPLPDKGDAFNATEKLRDPSHVRAMTVRELQELYVAAGLPEPRTTGYRLDGELESLLARSFPRPGDDDAFRARFAASVVDDSLGIAAWRDGDTLRYSYPVAVLVADRR